MKVSYNWLNNYFDKKLPPVGEVSDALTFHAFEIDGVEAHGDDSILDVKVTPNRGHDCLCHRGIAKELSAILKMPMNVPHDPFARGNESISAEGGAPQGDGPRTEQIPSKESAYPNPAANAGVSVEIKTPLCKRYIATHMKGVKVGPSPDWLNNSLEAIGQKSINNIVDATNMVMFNLGQPLHAFDAGKLVHKDGAYAIEVRPAKVGEKMLALDGKEYTLNESMLVIADADKDEAIGIAGVKGGMPAGISDTTTDIIIESANFDGVSVRKTASALKLRTDASARFEQVISPELAFYGMRQVVETILAVAGGEVVGTVDVYPEKQEQTYVSVTLEQINRVLGVQLTGADVADVFQRLGFSYKEESGVFEVQPPFERLDLVIAEDLIEEVGRIIGYDKITATPLPPFPKKSEINAGFYAAEKAREELIAQGYSEVFTSVFAESGERTVLNKVDGVKPHLRSDLKTGLLDAWQKNQPNKDLLGLKEVKLFEIGVVWVGGTEETHIATVDAKGVAAERVLEPIAAESYDAHPLSDAERYETFSRYPYIVRDVAFWTPAGTDEDVVMKEIEEKAGELCVRISLFDRFQKGEKTSLGYRLIFQSFERTLTEAEVNQIMQEISRILVEKGFEVR
ncbi:MAG TPA: phenylalanine--tRNA ligase subunit beta [Candidatus Paceibacterota bacterium]|nr:phenylalanine--tRNA ligase subunit beta [Candidatus Paceibacterota bacterium]